MEYFQFSTPCLTIASVDARAILSWLVLAPFGSFFGVGKSSALSPRATEHRVILINESSDE
jgi:hypothetical protein